MRSLPWFFLASVAFGQLWEPQSSGTTASLRGVSAVNANVVWASGSKGTFLHSSNGGTAWEVGQVPHAEGLDFRGIRAVDAQTVYLMSSGPSDKSQIFKTT